MGFFKNIFSVVSTLAKNKDVVESLIKNKDAFLELLAAGEEVVGLVKNKNQVSVDSVTTAAHDVAQGVADVIPVLHPQK